MAKTVTLRIEDEVYETLKEHAEAERRPLSNFIEVAALEYARAQEFADDEEMFAILSDKKLLERLKKSSKQAKKRKGKFVD